MATVVYSDSGNSVTCNGQTENLSDYYDFEQKPNNGWPIFWLIIVLLVVVVLVLFYGASIVAVLRPFLFFRVM